MSVTAILPETFLDGRVSLFSGDCLDVLAALPEASIDSVVTDPPYHLTSIVKRLSKARPDDVEKNFVNRKITGQGASPYKSTARGFMGKQWDGGDIAFRPETWAAVLRVLKPGAHLVAFGAPKNSHRLACAIEDAGFEIRDTVMWLFGSGFPKSHDVSKQLDKSAGDNPKDMAKMLRCARELRALSREDVAAAVGCTESSVRDWEEGRARERGKPVEWIIPSDEYRARLATFFGVDLPPRYALDARTIIGQASDRRSDGTVIGLGHSGELRDGGNTDAAAQWSGWGHCRC